MRSRNRYSFLLGRTDCGVVLVNLPSGGQTVRPNRAAGCAKIELPKRADDRDLFCIFEAIDWMRCALLMASLRGMHTGGYLPLSFDVTDLLQRAQAESVRLAERLRLGSKRYRSTARQQRLSSSWRHLVHR